MPFPLQSETGVDPLEGLKAWQQPHEDRLTFNPSEFRTFLPPSDEAAAQEAVGQAYYILKFVSLSVFEIIVGSLM